MVIGPLLGAVLGYLWAGSEPDLERARPDEFRRYLNATLPDGSPAITDITLHPFVMGGAGRPVQWISFTWHRRVRDTDRIVPVRVMTEAENPFLRNGDVGEDAAWYLTRQQQRNPQLRFRTAWWSQGYTGVWLGAAIGLAGIGVAWPVLLRLIGGPVVPREKKTRWRASKNQSESTTQTPVPDAASVKAYADDLESKLRVDATPRGTSSSSFDTPSGDTQPVVRALDGGPLEANPAANNAAASEGHFAGEYYPVFKADTKRDEKK
jgi:hypothetical protein